MSATTTIAVDAEVLKLIEGIAEKTSAQLGFSITKGAVVRNLVVARARELGLYPEKKMAHGPSVARARKDPSRPRRGER